MALWSRRSQEFQAEVTDSIDINFSSLPSSSEHCSVYLPPQDDPASSQPTTNGCNEYKPALPPKPYQCPPTYREPPRPPILDDYSQHPDICINSSSPPQRQIERQHYAQSVPPPERPDHINSRTHAWVQEHKTSGKLVGEKLSSLQRKLKSLLSQSPHSNSKDSLDIEKGSGNADEKHNSNGNANTKISHPVTEISRRSKSTPSIAFNMNSSSLTNDHHLTYMPSSSSSSFGNSLSISHSSVHGQHCNTFHQPERHPFGAPLTLSEHEDITDSIQLRDTCNKFFTREQRCAWSNYLNPRNCYSNNIKSSYDYDKLVPKEVIGRPSQEKKTEISANCQTMYEGVTPFPSFSKAIDVPPKQTEIQTTVPDGSYYARRVQNFNEESNLSEFTSKETKEPNKENEATTAEASPCGTITDCGDINDFYKSSSESGRGTMPGSMHGSKGLISPHSSGVSAASNLDTSLDSDHSGNGTLWDQQNHCSQENRCSEECQTKQHVYESPNATRKCAQSLEKEEVCEEATSESLSEIPPLPPISPAPSPPISAENSPKLSSKTKYKLSLSASALNSNYPKTTDSQQKSSEAISSKGTQGKKSGVRRNTSINQGACRHYSSKTKPQCSRGIVPSGHRLGIAHSNCTSKKCSNSPPTRHHSKIHMAFPTYPENADPELTSTTTGLDMESLLDDADDYSSDLSATTSTMDPNEVSMIRKQLEGLETMYSEILRLLGVKNSPCKGNLCSSSSMDISRHSRKRINGSLSSLTGRSSLSRGNHTFADKRGFSEKRRMKEGRNSSACKRLQRLESHVVTLARSVAHLSSEMRTQHILVQELENMRRDVTWVQERLRLMHLAQSCNANSGGGSKNIPLSLPRDWDNFRKEVLELLNPCRAKKLTKFFGDEPPLIRQFLKRLGYEKYAANFEAEKIGIKELPYLTEERLQKMGLPMGPRIRILQEAHACCQQNQYKVYIV